MHIKKKTNEVPAPSKDAVKRLAGSFAPPGTLVPDWVMEAMIVAYQNGRYDEACAETFDAVT